MTSCVARWARMVGGWVRTTQANDRIAEVLGRLSCDEAFPLQGGSEEQTLSPETLFPPVPLCPGLVVKQGRLHASPLEAGLTSICRRLSGLVRRVTTRGLPAESQPVPLAPAYPSSASSVTPGCHRTFKDHSFQPWEKRRLDVESGERTRA